MGWECRLYGHWWRHAGMHEVILTEDNGSVYPFRCAVCDDEKLLRSVDTNWVSR